MWQVRAESQGGGVVTFGMEADDELAWERALRRLPWPPLAVKSMTVDLFYSDPPRQRPAARNAGHPPTR